MNITLPRRFGSVSPQGVNYSNASDHWIKPDNQRTGLSTFSQNSSHIYAEDWNNCEPGDCLMYVTANDQTIHAPVFDPTTGLITAASNGSAILRKLKQDNSRYTLFVRDKTVWSPDYVEYDTIVNPSNVGKRLYLESQCQVKDVGGGFVTAQFRDPALKTYIPYMKKIDLSVGKGYDTPSNIASGITDQLIRADDPQPLTWTEAGRSEYPEIYANKNNATLYQEFPAANAYTYETLAYNSFLRGSEHTPDGIEDLSIQSFNYLNNYAYVGFKRPEFVMKGRELNSNAGLHILKTIHIASASTAVIETDLAWNDTNLKKMRDFFDVQGKFYRELISANRETNSNYTASFLESYYGTTSASLNGSFEDVARFLHINPYSYQTLRDTLILNGSTTSYIQQFNVSLAQYSLGNEMAYMADNPYTHSGSNVSQTFSNSSATIYNRYPYDLSSLPIYVFYNKNSSLVTPDQSDGNGYHNLVYGFARKTSSNTIGLTTERIGGIHNCHFNDGLRTAQTAPTGTAPAAGWPFIQGDRILGGLYYDDFPRRIGYDYHFNAYGNAAIVLNNGYTRAGYYGHQQKVAWDISRGCYLGADNPVLNFNTVNNRFEFSNLHTAEKIGNFWNAGDPDPAGSEVAPPAATGADTDCYKINKIDQYNTWSPSMMPYPEISVVKKNSTSHTFPVPNVNIERDAIMDSHCGITITDMGVTQELWDESIWGILGFSYQQFYPNASIVGNINTRMNNVIINVSGATTNALISSVDGPEYNVNAFGTTVYTTQMGLATDYDDTANWMLTGGSAQFKDINIIVVSATSTAISAQKLPRKQLRGYFLLSSNILSDANYYREANPLQVMAIVDKYNAEGDFINYSGGGTVFTVTKPTTLTSVRTAILDPDGSPAQVGKYSGVIYRIDKQINTDLNFAETILQQQNQKK
jgi:hypothetical protein